MKREKVYDFYTGKIFTNLLNQRRFNPMCIAWKY